MFLFTECVFVNDGGKSRFSDLLKLCQGKKSLYSAFFKQIKISMSTHEFKKILDLVL